MTYSAGLVKLKVTSNSSTRTSAASSISTATRSSGASSAMSKNGTLFGVYAQRSTIGLGYQNNYLKYNSPATSELRHSLNDGRTPLFNNIVLPQPSNDDSSNKFLGIMMGVGLGVGLLGTVFKGIAELKASGNVGQGVSPTDAPSNKKVSGNDAPLETSGDKNSAALKDMKGAKDSVSLRSAIENAETQKANIQSNLTSLESEIPNLKAASETATKQLEDLEPKVKSKEAEIKEKKSDVSQTKQSVEALKRSVDSKLEVLKNFTDQKNTAETNYNQAASDLSQARTNLSNTPQYVTDASGNSVPNEPAYSNAQQAVKNAEQKLADAKKALEDATKNEANANKAYNDAVETYGAENKKLSEKQEQLKTEEQELQNLREDLKELQQQQKDANNAVEKYKDALEEQKKLQSDVTKYTNEIDTQKKRLEEMEKAEAKELTDISKQMNSIASSIADRNDDINAVDGLNVREKVKMKRNERGSEKYADLREKQNDLQMRQNYTKLYSMPSVKTASDGTQFRKAEFGGETLYMIGAQKVSEEEYNARLQQLELS